MSKGAVLSGGEIEQSEEVIGEKMDQIVEKVSNLNIADSSNNNLKKNRIQVSNTKKPLFFYVNLAKERIDSIDEFLSDLSQWETPLPDNLSPDELSQSEAWLADCLDVTDMTIDSNDWNGLSQSEVCLLSVPVLAFDTVYPHFIAWVMCSSPWLLLFIFGIVFGCGSFQVGKWWC